MQSFQNLVKKLVHTYKWIVRPTRVSSKYDEFYKYNPIKVQKIWKKQDKELEIVTESWMSKKSQSPWQCSIGKNSHDTFQ